MLSLLTSNIIYGLKNGGATRKCRSAILLFCIGAEVLMQSASPSFFFVVRKILLKITDMGILTRIMGSITKTFDYTPDYLLPQMSFCKTSASFL